MPTPSPESSTAPALPLRLLLLARSCCSPDRAPLRRRVHPPAPRCRPRCPSRGASSRARFPSRPRPCQNPSTARSPPLAGPLRTHPRSQIPALNRLSARPSPSLDLGGGRWPGRGAAELTVVVVGVLDLLCVKNLTNPQTLALLSSDHHDRVGYQITRRRLIIDEPKLNLHPDNQCSVARTMLSQDSEAARGLARSDRPQCS